MRLVDADKLPIKYDGHTVGVWQIDLEKAPTVEAIPIEQIKKKLLSSQYEYENDYDIGFDKGWNCALRALLRDWEKENANN